MSGWRAACALLAILPLLHGERADALVPGALVACPKPCPVADAGKTVNMAGKIAQIAKDTARKIAESMAWQSLQGVMSEKIMEEGREASGISALSSGRAIEESAEAARAERAEGLSRFESFLDASNGVHREAAAVPEFLKRMLEAKEEEKEFNADATAGFVSALGADREELRTAIRIIAPVEAAQESLMPGTQPGIALRSSLSTAIARRSLAESVAPRIDLSGEGGGSALALLMAVSSMTHLHGGETSGHAAMRGKAVIRAARIRSQLLRYENSLRREVLSAVRLRARFD